jgi:hypothetical protein
LPKKALHTGTHGASPDEYDEPDASDAAPVAMAILLLNYADLESSRNQNATGNAAVAAVADAQNSTVTIQLSWMGYGKGPVAVRDLYLHKDLGTFTGSFVTDAFGAHDSRMYILTPTPTDATDASGTEAAATNSNDTASGSDRVSGVTSHDDHGAHNTFSRTSRDRVRLEVTRLVHSLDTCTDRCLLLGHCNGIKDPTQGCDSKPSCAAGCAFAQVQYTVSHTRRSISVQTVPTYIYYIYIYICIL